MPSASLPVGASDRAATDPEGVTEPSRAFSRFRYWRVRHAGLQVVLSIRALGAMGSPQWEQARAVMDDMSGRSMFRPVA